MSAFTQEGGDWTRYRQLTPNREIDFHVEHELPRHLRGSGAFAKNMADARERALKGLRDAYEDEIPWVILRHGHSTSAPGKTTIRSVIRQLMQSKDSTPFVIKKLCIQHDSVFVAAIRPKPPAK